MAIALNTISVPDGANGFSESNAAKIGLILSTAYVAGGGAGAAVTLAIALPTTGDMPANYAVFVEVGQDATAYVTSKTAAGFTVNVLPRLAANTLAAGTANILIVG